MTKAGALAATSPPNMTASGRRESMAVRIGVKSVVPNDTQNSQPDMSLAEGLSFFRCSMKTFVMSRPYA